MQYNKKYTVGGAKLTEVRKLWKASIIGWRSDQFNMIKKHILGIFRLKECPNGDINSVELVDK